MRIASCDRRLGEIESIPGIVTAGGLMAEALSKVARVAPSERLRPAAGRERHRQGARGPSHPRGQPARATDRSSPSTLPPSPPLCSRASSSATSAAPSPAPIARESAASRAPRGGTLFLDEIGDLPVRQSRSSSCGSCRSAPSRGSAPTDPSQSTCAWSRPPTTTCRPGCRTEASGKTSTTAWRS